MNPLETYLIELREIHDSGAATRETSGYPALAKLLDTAGHSLKPKVRCLIQLKNSGAGLPDGGLFTPDQLKHTDDQAPLFGLAPARGVMEVKPTSDELSAIGKTEQVEDYLSLYGQLLLTNYRDFLLLKRGPGATVHHRPDSAPTGTGCELPARQRCSLRVDAMNSVQMHLFSAGPGGFFSVPPGDFARPGLVDRGFVERSVAAMRDLPDAERRLRANMAEHMESIRAIDLVYRGELNEWAASTRERVWQEYFTAKAILNRLKSQPALAAIQSAPSTTTSGTGVVWVPATRLLANKE